MKIFELTTWIYSFLTFSKRYRPEIKWSRHSWTHNAFRAFELVFGREFGIRPEVVSSSNGETTTYHIYTIEAALAFAEYWVRSKMPKIKLVEVSVPQFAPVGFPLQTKTNYMFAIAFDNSDAGEVTLGTSVTLSNVCTGSDLVLVLMGTDNGATSLQQPVQKVVALPL